MPYAKRPESPYAPLEALITREGVTGAAKAIEAATGRHTKRQLVQQWRLRGKVSPWAEPAVIQLSDGRRP